jgi:hypothetical protein
VGEEGRQPTPEELAEQIKQIDVADLVLSTVSTLGQLAYVKLGANDREQARLAIDGIAALLPTLEGKADEQLLRDLKQLLANVRLAFVSSAEPAASPEPEAEPEPEPEPDAGQQGAGGQETAQEPPDEADARG